jgi:Zn-dependent alcohol dehydrogenase
MRGAVYWEPNKPLTIEEFHIPRPKAGELLIKTKGMCLCVPTSFFILTIYFIQFFTLK